MKIEFDLWQMVGLALTISGAFWGLARMLINASSQSICEQFQSVAKLIEAQSRLIKDQGDDVRRIERDLMGLKADLPREYVRREDYTAAISMVMVKIDSLALRMEEAIRQAYTHVNKGDPRNER